ncbi:MAG: hypothetical protein JWM11_3352 [Planctomycetaceae bacterium]|nr:hypothetical protein [Planctomycetaceae bacterium]
MEVTSDNHISSNGRSTLGHLQLTIGRVGAMVSDGTQGDRIDEFLDLAQSALDQFRAARAAGSFDGVLPVVVSAGDTTIELDMTFSAKSVTKTHKPDEATAVVTVIV